MVTEFESYLDFRWYEGLLYLSTLILYIYIVIFVYWNIVCTELCMYKYVLRKINQLRKKKKRMSECNAKWEVFRWDNDTVY